MTDQHGVTLQSVALIAVGGFAGANVRYAVAAVGGLSPLAATLVANVGGSLALGLLVYWRVHVGSVARPLRLAFGTGFLSSLTTYSTFAVLTAESALGGGGPVLAGGFVAANYGLGLVGVLVGRELARRVPGGHA